MKRGNADQTKCPKCGTPRRIYERVCSHCGARLEPVELAPIALGDVGAEPSEPKGDGWDPDSFLDETPAYTINPQFWGVARFDASRPPIETARVEELADRLGRTVRVFEPPREDAEPERGREESEEEARRASEPERSPDTGSREARPFALSVELERAPDVEPERAEPGTQFPLNAELDRAATGPDGGVPFKLDEELKEAEPDAPAPEDVIERRAADVREEPEPSDLPEEDERGEEPNARPEPVLPPNAPFPISAHEYDATPELPDFTLERSPEIEIPDLDAMKTRSLSAPTSVTLPDFNRAEPSPDRPIKLSRRRFFAICRAPETRLVFVGARARWWFAAVVLELILCFPCGLLAYRSLIKVFQRLARRDFHGATRALASTRRRLLVGVAVVAAEMALFLCWLATKVEWSEIRWLELQ